MLACQHRFHFFLNGNSRSTTTATTSELADPLDFLAEITQHVPNTGEHTIRYYGWYSNKSRGMRAKLAGMGEAAGAKNIPFNMAGCNEENDTPFQKLCRSRWAALIKKVYEVDPLKCPRCGGRMRIVSFIENRDQADVIERILKHCGLWSETKGRAPPVFTLEADGEVEYIPIDEFLANF